MTADEVAKMYGGKIKTVSKTSPQNIPKTAENETKNTRFDKDVSKERCISLKERQKTIDDLRLI